MENFEVVHKSVSVKTNFARKSNLTGTKKRKKNRNRTLRRRKNKLKQVELARRLRLENPSMAIWGPFAPIVSMNSVPPNLVPSYPMPEVAEWHNKNDIAYWKSRAISLELENKMLHEHIQKMHRKRISEYVSYMKQMNVDANISDGNNINKQNCNEEGNGGDDYDEEEEYGEEEYEYGEEESSDTGRNYADDTEQEQEDLKKPPEKESSGNKQKQMENLYGSKAAAIMGMETALQLNYDLNMDMYKPVVWPNIPFRV